MHSAGVDRTLEITKPYAAAPGIVAKRLRQAHELWAEKSTFRRPTNGSWAAKEKGKGKEIGPPSQEVLEKELRFPSLPPNSTFGFSRVSGIVRAPTGSRTFLEEFAKVHTVQKDADEKWRYRGTMTWRQHTAAVKKGRGTQPLIRDAIAPFLKSNMFRESYERAGLASRLGEDVHARILLRCVAADTRSRWTDKIKAGEHEESVMITEQPAVHLVQHLFPANEIPRVMFASMKPATKKRTPLADEVARLESGLWNLVKVAFPNWRFVGCEYDALWPHGLFLTSGSGSGGGGGRSRGPSSSVAASTVAVSVCPSAKRSYPFRGASHASWRFLKIRIDAIVVDQQSGELVLIDYKTQIGDSTQDDLASVSHILQVVTNAYVLYACSGIVVDTCALLYTNRRGVSRAVTVPFRQQLATKHSFVQRSLHATFSALPSVHVDRHYVFEAGLGAEWSLFGILDPLHESLPHLQPSVRDRGQTTPFAGVLGPSMQLVGEKEGEAQPPKYEPIPEFHLNEAVHKTKPRLRVFLWAHDPLVRQTAGKDPSSHETEQKRLPPTAALLSGFPATATTRLRRRPTSPPKRKKRVSPRIKRLKALGGKGRGKAPSSQISSVKEITESGVEEPSEIPTSEGEDIVASEAWSTQAVVGLATDNTEEDEEKTGNKEEMKHLASRAALNRSVQLAGEELVKHPIAAEKSARWLRAQLRVFAGPADSSGINHPLSTGKAYSPTQQKTEAVIRAINRTVNTQVFAKLRAEQAAGKKGPKNERPLPLVFPHLSQRAWWNFDLLTYARDEVPSILSRMKLHVEKAHRTASGYGSV
eukprot:TRINITY_DN1158_c0_g1_i10.p1 TRINITY_DN1158_c0_g1~~TRINITY_DN1158_c0_g1_i10.p1  ORF type:complete len:814 (-),score=-17.16 TRINITY_DN1158_c0_g1_i10:19-2460(-)